MRKIITLAKLELSTLFCSPIAWILIIVFLFQTGFTYTANLQNYLTVQLLGGGYSSRTEALTSGIFSGYGGVFNNIVSKIYLYLPLLTMGLISKELSTGTIKFLYSSPLKIREIVLGKFLAMAIYNLILIAMLAIFVAAALYNIKNADAGLLVSGLLGIYLLLCTYAAIGLFMSSLTAYQVVAAISTLVIFAILEYLKQVWQDIDLVRDLTYYMSISGRTSQFIDGLITSRDVMYFLIVTAMFLALSDIRLQSGRKYITKSALTGKYLLALLTSLLVILFSSSPRFNAYYDATQGKSMTLSVGSQKLIKQFGEQPLEVTSYINLLDQRYFAGRPEDRNKDMARWDAYLRFKHNINLKYVYYYDTPLSDPDFLRNNPGKSLKQTAEQYASTMQQDIGEFKSPAEIAKIINLQPELNRYVIVLKYRHQKVFLRLFDDPWVMPSESEIAVALKRLIVKAPRLGFLTDELERSTTLSENGAYKNMIGGITNRNALVNQGFEVVNLSLKNEEIPNDLTALVIADPQIQFSMESLVKIEKYVKNGGNLLIAGEPGKADVIKPLLDPLGVELLPGTIIQKNKENANLIAMPELTKNGLQLFKGLKQQFHGNPGISMPGAAALSVNARSTYQVVPLLMTNKYTTWNRKNKIVPDLSSMEGNISSGDDEGPFNLAFALTRQVNDKTQHIVITGDADFLSNSVLADHYSNLKFGTAIFSWFADQQFPVETSRPLARDTDLNLSKSGIAKLKFLLLGLIPGLLLTMAAVFLINRSKK